MIYYIYCEQKQIGPLQAEEIGAYKISPATKVWREDQETWKDAKEFEELKRYFYKMPPPLILTPPPLDVDDAGQERFVEIILSRRAEITDHTAMGGLRRIKFDGKYGLIDSENKVVCNVVYDSILLPDMEHDEVSREQKRIRVVKEGKYGYINVDGHLVIDAKFAEATPFYNRPYAIITEPVVDRYGKKEDRISKNVIDRFGNKPFNLVYSTDQRIDNIEFSGDNYLWISNTQGFFDRKCKYYNFYNIETKQYLRDHNEKIVSGFQARGFGLSAEKFTVKNERNRYTFDYKSGKLLDRQILRFEESLKTIDWKGLFSDSDNV
jgi:hypothetical protein